MKKGKSFAEQLQGEKERIGLTLDQLAEILGAGRRSVAHWLGGKREPLKIAQEGALARLAQYESAKRK